MRCPRCGNENPGLNRFCGMCGATLLAASEVPAAQPQRVATTVSSAPTESAPVKPQISEPPRASDGAPAISGPSFLGLNDPPPRKRASLSIDHHDAPGSGNLDYLLDDEEEHKHSGAGKIFLILIALALAVGFGYLRWRNQGFGWMTSSNKPSAAKDSSATPSNSPTSPTSAPDSPPPVSNPNGSQPTADSPAPSANPASTTSAPPPAASGAAPSAPPATSPPAASTSKSSDVSKSPDAASPTTPDKASPPSAKEPVAKAPAADTSAAESDTDTSDTADQPKPTPAPPAPKPHAAAKPVTPVDPVTEAQKYLYGRGAPQDCDRGLRLLKPAANQANPKAMVEMGALYSAGLCTPHDLPTAYRWFALALRKDPENQAVQNDLQKLWGEMTQPERKLAIQMTQ